MTTADYALAVSIISALVSLSSFLWNVWSKFLYPRAKVRVTLKSIISIGQFAGDEVRAISMTAINFGPTEITLKLAYCESGRIFGRKKYAILKPISNFPSKNHVTDGPFSGGLPKKLAVGEEFSIYFIENHSTFAGKGEFNRFGFSDVFGRTHLASRRDTIEVRKHANEALERTGVNAQDHKP